MPPLARDCQNEQIENKPPGLYRGKLTFNLATIDRPPGKPPVLHRGQMTFVPSSRVIVTIPRNKFGGFRPDDQPLVASQLTQV